MVSIGPFKSSWHTTGGIRAPVHVHRVVKPPHGLTRWLNSFLGLLDRETPKLVLDNVTESFSGHMAEQFDAEGSHLTGHRWVGLSRNYQYQKARSILPSTHILQRTGGLLASAVNPKVISKGRDQRKIIIDSPLAYYHHMGVPSRNLPSRPIIGLPPDLIKEWTGVLEDGVAFALVKASE